MYIQAIKTHRIVTQDSLEAILDHYIVGIQEGAIVALTSKIVSILQGRVVPKGEVPKETLIRQEADAVLETEASPYGIILTLKNGFLIPSAGIDESNGDNVYILYPLHIQAMAHQVWQHLKKQHRVHHLGVIITDSHTTPLRRGVTGKALGWCGFEPLYSYVGKPDLYQHPLKTTCLNVLDSLASAAVFVMGEGSEQTPLATIQDAPKVVFLDREASPEEVASVCIPLEEDLYAPFLRPAKWSLSKK
jgi:dihydrofolate synthase / folylpolyglutamate synthase